MNAMLAPRSTHRSNLSGGFYTVSEASRILRLRTPSVVGQWLDGGSQTLGPTLVRQYKDASDVGFWDLMEIRFVNYFRGRGVSLQQIRKAAARARDRFNTSHPFALSNIKFKTDRKQIFAEIAIDEGSKELEEMTTGQLTFYEIVEDFLAEGVEFDLGSNLAIKWRPEPLKFPDIVLDPLKAYGHPSVGDKGLPTRALFLNWKAEGFSSEAVADWFEIGADLVEQAVEYELGLDA